MNYVFSLPRFKPLIKLLLMPEGHRKTPTTITLPYVETTSAVVDGYPIHTFFVTADNFLELPLDANVRLPSEKSVPYKEMIKTLKERPQKFLLQNSGISVIAGKVGFKKSNMVELLFPPDTGIVNGGHTQKAILDSKESIDVSRAMVKIEILEKEFEPGELAEIAASRNTASNVKPYSTAEKKGLFVPIKDEMEEKFEKHIIWYENREVPNDRGFASVDLIALLNLFSLEFQSSLNPETSDQPNRSATGKASVFAEWEKGEKKEIKCVYPLTNDILSLMEHVESTFDKGISQGFTRFEVVKNVEKLEKTTLFLGKKMRFELPKQFLYPVLAAFRANIFFDGDTKSIGWYVKPEEAFDKCKRKLFEDLGRTYKSTYHNEINRASKDSNLWRILYLDVDSAIDKSARWKTYEIRT
ncbi:MAG TPA: AIPR family protein [Verrucomicrobiae bacterium]|nr:AIPR family protein [Verrucomicrobiae bacterium]